MPILAGTLYSDTGVMQVTDLGAGAVPGTAIFVAGIAHEPTGERYVTTNEAGGVIFVAGQRVRADGAQIYAAADPEIYHGGIGYRSNGALSVVEDGVPVTWTAGRGLTAAGRSCINTVP